MITGKDYDLQPLLEQCAESIANHVERLKKGSPAIEQAYLDRLFRYHTWADYVVGGAKLRLFMTGIDSFGRLLLVDAKANDYCFNIKEIRFLI